MNQIQQLAIAMTPVDLQIKDLGYLVFWFTVRMGETGEGRTSGARDVASATQAERCALHHHACPVFVGRSACRTQQKEGGEI